MDPQETKSIEQPKEPRVPVRRVAVVHKKKKDKDVLVAKKKLDLFLEEYEKNGGNGTQAALKVFDTTSTVNAANIAAHYLKRAQSLGRMVMEKKGYTYEKMVESAWEKNKISKTPEWWDRLMKLGGYEDFMTKGTVTKATVSVMTVQKNVLDEYVEGEYVEDEKESEDE